MLTKTHLRFVLLTTADAERLSDVAKQAYSDHYLHLWHDAGAWYIARSFSPDVLRVELADTNARFYFLYENEEPLGFMKLNMAKPSPCMPAANALELERIYLRKEATGKGIGEKAMAFVIDMAKEAGKELIWLKAMDSSHGVIAFYQKMGFVQCGTDRLPFTVMREELRQMVAMHRIL